MTGDALAAAAAVGGPAVTVSVSPIAIPRIERMRIRRAVTVASEKDGCLRTEERNRQLSARIQNGPGAVESIRCGGAGGPLFPEQVS
ncbi:hypothetical protein JCM9533A_09210 [Catenuloplanes niger JCM 9533]